MIRRVAGSPNPFASAPTSPTSSLPPIVAARCHRAEGCDTSRGSVRLEGDRGHDLVPYLKEEELELSVELVGQPPLWTWILDVDVCVSAAGSYRYRL